MDKFNLKHIETLSKTDAKEYIIQYFIPLTNGNHAFLNNGIYDILDEQTIKRTYFKRMDKYLSTYYFEEFKDLRTIVYEINKPTLFDDKLNLCPSFMHQYKPFESFEQETKNKVQVLLKHIEKVLCSGSKPSSDFLIKWFAKASRGEKNDSCLYLKGPQGIGKSCLTEWIRESVFGNPLCVQTGSGPLKTKFNGELSGKLLVIFEELENFSVSEWQSISSVLKRQITSKTIMIERKGKDAEEQTNLNNYILLSNNDAIQDDDGRRYFILDISTSKLGDDIYWSELHDNILTKEVGEAFYAYLYEIDLKGFRSQSYPITQSKKDSYVKRLDVVHKFLKDSYVLSTLCIDKVKVVDLYDEFIEYCNRNDISKIKTKIDFNNSLKNIGINSYKSNGSNYYKVSISELKAISNKFHWIHDLDDVEEKPISKPKVKILSKAVKELDIGLITDDFIDEPIINEPTTKTKTTKKVVKKVVKKVPVISDKETEELFDLF
jgi:hypothetical protein